MNITSNYFVIIDGIIALMFLIFIIKGFKNGFVYELINLVFLILSLFVSWFISPILASRIQIIDLQKNANTLLNLSSINNVVNTIIWFVILTVVINLLYLLIKPLFKTVSKIPVVGTLNRILGSLINVLYAFVITLLISMLFTFPIFKNGKDVINGTVLKYADEVSSIITKAVVNNIDYSKLQDTIDNFNIDNERQEVLNWFIEQGILDE